MLSGVLFSLFLNNQSGFADISPRFADTISYFHLSYFLFLKGIHVGRLRFPFMEGFLNCLILFTDFSHVIVKIAFKLCTKVQFVNMCFGTRWLFSNMWQGNGTRIELRI